MSDLRERFRDLDALDVPDVLARANAIGPHPPTPEPGRSVGRRVAIGAFALAVGLAGIFVANRVTRGEQVPGGEVPCSTGYWQQPFVSSVAGVTRNVAAPSPDDIWTLALKASANGSTSIRRGTLLHLSGDGWRPVDLPPAPVYDMEASPSGEVWMLSAEAVWHLTGSSWVRLPLPQPSSSPGSVLPFGLDDVWVTGDVPGASGAREVWHWNGTTWSEVALPTLPRGASIVALGGTASDDVWAISSSPDAVQPFHWDGATWAALPSQPITREYGSVTKIVVRARNDAWLMVGTHLFHWDGAAWAVAPTPARSTPAGSGRWVDLAAGPSGTWFVDGAAGPHGRLDRWDGSKWVPAVPTPTDRYLSARGSGETLRLAVVGNEVVVVHGPYQWIRRNPNGSGQMGPGAITAYVFTCGS